MVRNATAARTGVRRGKGCAVGAGRSSTAPQSPRVRVIPPGVSGEDLQEELLAALRAGTVWLRGCQRVRVLVVTPRYVTVRELDHGAAARRRLRRGLFLCTARPERKGRR